MLLRVILGILGLGMTICAVERDSSSAFSFRGISYPAWSAEEYSTPASDASLFRIKATGANYVAIVATGYMDTATSTTVYADPILTPSDSSVIHAVKAAHSYGLKVMLKPHVDPKDGTWRGQIAPTDVSAWFDSYKDFLFRYVKIAREYGVELLCVGTEFGSLSGPGYREFWAKIIAAIREVYPGSLVYAANWDEYRFVSFWDLLDYVGIDAYFPLSDARTPCVAELLLAWDSWVAAIENWQSHIGKPVIFTEIGYRSIDYPAKEPWNWTRVAPYNAEAQANCYEAAFRALAGRPWFAGMFWWNWVTNPHAGGPGDIDYTPQNKPAQDVLTKWFGK